MIKFKAPGVAADQLSLFASPGAISGNISDTRPTPEQDAIIDAYWAGQHITVEALAGTGKTTSLRMISEARNQREGCYIAYNRAIAAEAAGRFPQSVTTGTAHSFAYRAVGHRFARRLPGRRGSTSIRMTAAQVAEVLRLRDQRVADRLFSASSLARIVEATVTRFCQSAACAIGAEHIPPVVGADATLYGLDRRILSAAEVMWRDICDPFGRLWFSHDHYLKMWQLSNPALPGEYVLFDEAQDANPVIAAIVGAQDHAQLIYVGDRAQAIYGWRGAVDAMQDFSGIRLPLTRSWRFGEAIADEANKWLAALDSPLRVTGNDAIRSRLGHVSRPDAVLCRSNGGAIGEVLVAQERGRRVALVGDGVEVRRFAFAARSLMAGKGCDMPELAGFRTWRELQEYVEEEESGSDLKILVKLVNRYKPSRLIAAVQELCPPGEADLVVSTAHKAKGLEWGEVAIGSDFRPPLDGDRPDPAELMLAYVSVTRAKKALDPGSLAWIDGGKFDDEKRWLPSEPYRDKDTK